jgi:hypothetical protein
MGPDPLQVLGVSIDGKYDLTDFVEQRGARYIYRATHRYWGEPVAVGLYAHDLSGSVVEQEAAHRSYLRTGALLAALSSRNSAFVQTRDCGIIGSPLGELAYLIAEWVDAETLDQVLTVTREIGSARLGLSATLEWLHDVMRALSMAHEAGMVHGALCPSNIFVIGGAFRPSTPLKLRGLTDAAWRASGVTAGPPPRPSDPRYAAPEVVAAAHDPTLLGPWTDIYGLACLVAELVSGSAPSPGGAVAAAEPYISRQCLFAFERALSPDPNRRFKSVEMFKAALFEGMGVRGGRSPRRTMVVADQLRADGSAGSFEIGGDLSPMTADAPADADAAQPRVRLAFTQRVEAADTTTPPPAARRTLVVPNPGTPAKGTTPAPARPPGVAEYGSGVYEQLTQDRSRTIVIVLAILAFGGMAAYLIVAMGAR